jgi:hypothetical protein
MSAIMTFPLEPILKAYNVTARAVRKVRQPRRFNRARAALPLVGKVRDYWEKSDAALIAFLDDDGGWEVIAQHTGAVAKAERFPVLKELSAADKRLIAELIAKVGFFADAQSMVDAITAATALPTFEQASKFALGQLGVSSSVFELRNEGVRARILDRASTLRYSSERHGADTLATIVRNFYDLGRNPYNDAFLKDLKRTIGVQTDFEAKRFALTETAIVSEMATHETWKRNGVGRKKWNATGVNTRESHLALAGVEVPMDRAFQVGDAVGDHPCDPGLPPEELVNCHCWLTPVVDDSFDLDPRSVWEGQ